VLAWVAGWGDRAGSSNLGEVGGRLRAGCQNAAWRSASALTLRRQGDQGRDDRRFIVSAVPSRSLGRRPADPAARERLREVQAAETRAVAAYYFAAARADTAREVLSEAESDLAAAVRSVVATSGQERAMILLGLDRSELRQAITSARPPQ
jgi:hypothetical protein